MTELPHNARDFFHFPKWQREAIDRAASIAYRMGVWRYPAARQGDLARMGKLDLAYWFFKAGYPIERAERGSGLESFFDKHAMHRWSPPNGFDTDQVVTISAVGDLMSHVYLGGSEGVLYADVADAIFGADLSTANLECMLQFDAVGEPRLTSLTGPKLFFDHPTWDAVRRHGDRQYDFLATANNHSLDFGADGLDATLDMLDRDGIAHHGGNRDERHAAEACVVERQGVRIALLSWTFGLNAQRPPKSRPHAVNHAPLNDGPRAIDFRGIDAQIADAKNRSDFVLAQLHWGMEFERYPTRKQIELAHALAERGIDAIIGHHPHVTQPLEAYRTTRDRDRVVPIFYSLGNLTNPFLLPEMCVSGLARLRIAKGNNGAGELRTYMVDARLEGIEQSVDRRARTVRLTPMGPLSAAGR